MVGFGLPKSDSVGLSSDYHQLKFGINNVCLKYHESFDMHGTNKCIDLTGTNNIGKRPILAP